MLGYTRVASNRGGAPHTFGIVVVPTRDILRDVTRTLLILLPHQNTTAVYDAASAFTATHAFELYSGRTRVLPTKAPPLVAEAGGDALAHVVEDVCDSYYASGTHAVAVIIDVATLPKVVTCDTIHRAFTDVIKAAQGRDVTVFVTPEALATADRQLVPEARWVDMADRVRDKFVDFQRNVGAIGNWLKFTHTVLALACMEHGGTPVLAGGFGGGMNVQWVLERALRRSKLDVALRVGGDDVRAIVASCGSVDGLGHLTITPGELIAASDIAVGYCAASFANTVVVCCNGVDIAVPMLERRDILRWNKTITVVLPQNEVPTWMEWDMCPFEVVASIHRLWHATADTKCIESITGANVWACAANTLDRVPTRHLAWVQPFVQALDKALHDLLLYRPVEQHQLND